MKSFRFSNHICKLVAERVVDFHHEYDCLSKKRIYTQGNEEGKNASERQRQPSTNENTIGVLCNSGKDLKLSDRKSWSFGQIFLEGKALFYRTGMDLCREMNGVGSCDAWDCQYEEFVVS